MQRPEIAQMGSLHVFFKHLSTTQPSAVYSYHLCQEKKPIGIVVCFQKVPVLEMAMLLEVPK